MLDRWERWTGRGTLGPKGPGNRRPDSNVTKVLASVRWAVRELSRNPAFSTSMIAVLTVALGVSSAAFAFTDGVLLKPLRYVDSDRLVAVWAARSGEGLDRVPLTQWDIQQVMARTDVFESVGGSRSSGAPCNSPMA